MKYLETLCGAGCAGGVGGAGDGGAGDIGGGGQNLS